MENIEIVTLQPQQWLKYKSLRLRALKEEPQAFTSTYEEGVKYPYNFWQERLKQALAGNSQWLLFAKHGDNLVGMAGGYITDEKNTAEVVGIYVAKEARGQGISKKLIINLISRIKQNKAVKKLLIGVNPEQVEAVCLYQSLGFKIIGKEKVIFGDCKQHDSYEMELGITPVLNS
jgi:ribosomal protein S18 acetylase RimI-like enzyme